MRFEFGRTTEITEFAKKYNPDYKDYLRIFICPDVWDFHILRIIKGYNEDYEKDEKSYIFEHQKIKTGEKSKKISSFSQLKEIINEDDMGNWDYYQSYDLIELFDRIDGGFGIIDLAEYHFAEEFKIKYPTPHSMEITEGEVLADVVVEWLENKEQSLEYLPMMCKLLVDDGYNLPEKEF